MEATATNSARGLFIQGPSRTHQLRWWILAVLSVTLGLAAMDTTIVYVAIPTIQPELDASGAGLQWIVDSYVIVFAGLLLTMGALGDRFGRRHLLQIGVAIFGLASILAAFAGSTGELITARALTGIGGAMMLPATLSIIIDVFPQHERAKAIAIWSAVAGIGAPTGQIVGGVLLEYFWWGSVFLINVPVTAFIFAASALIVPNSRDTRERPVDLPGALALSSATLSALVFAIIEAAERGWTDPLVLGGFAVAAILAAVFAAYELWTRFPMIDLRLLKNRRLSAGAAAMITSFLVMLGGFFLLSQFLQFARGYSALETGLILIPFPLGFALASTFSERAVVSMGTNRIAAGGLGLLALSLALMSFFTLGTEIWVIALVLLAFGMGGGAVMAPGTVAMMEGIPEESSGAGAALNEVTRLIGIALGVSILGSIANSAFSSEMERGVPGVPNEASLEASDSIGSAHQVAAGLGGAPGEALASAANSAYVDAFTLATLVAAGIAAVAAVVILRVMPARQFAAGGTALSQDENDLTTELAASSRPIRGGADVGRRSIMLKNFAGTTVWSEDLNNLLPFYRDTLGLKPGVESPEFVVFGDSDKPSMALGTHSEVKGKNSDPARHMVGFESDDLDGDFHALKSKGVEFIEEPTEYSGLRIATLKDPEGNLVQLFQPTG